MGCDRTKTQREWVRKRVRKDANLHRRQVLKQLSGSGGSVKYVVDTLGFRHMLYHLASGPHRAAVTKIGTVFEVSKGAYHQSTEG